MKHLNRRRTTAGVLVIVLALLLAVMIAGHLLADMAMQTDFSRANLAPTFTHVFGTDWLGRDMLSRTLVGLSLSIRLGLLTSVVSAVLAFLWGALAALGGRVADAFVAWLIDLMMAIPHLLLLILIAFACGKGFTGIVVGITVTHWMPLARVLRAEILQLRLSGYVQVARKLGVSKPGIVWRHMVPHLFPQFLVGLVMLFPHAILHEASITFLGFGLPPEQPAIGIILSESMRYLALGQWWLALFPGLLLLLVVMLFYLAGSSLRKLTDPASVHE